MGESDIIIEARPEHGEGREGHDLLELGDVGGAPLLVRRVVFDQVLGHVGEEGLGHVLLRVQRLEEAVEDGPLRRLRGRAPGAVGRARVVGAQTDVEVGRGGGGEAVPVVGDGEEEGEGGQGREDDWETHFSLSVSVRSGMVVEMFSVRGTLWQRTAVFRSLYPSSPAGTLDEGLRNIAGSMTP